MTKEKLAEAIMSSALSTQNRDAKIGVIIEALNEVERVARSNERNSIVKEIEEEIQMKKYKSDAFEVSGMIEVKYITDKLNSLKQ